MKSPVEPLLNAPESTPVQRFPLARRSALPVKSDRQAVTNEEEMGEQEKTANLRMLLTHAHELTAEEQEAIALATPKEPRAMRISREGDRSRRSSAVR